MIKYKLICPIHNTSLITEQVVKVKEKTGETKKPIFFCQSCQRYYLYNKEVSEPKKLQQTYKNYPIYLINNSYYVFDDKKEQNQRDKMSKDSVRAKNKGVDKKIRREMVSLIHILIKIQKKKFVFIKFVEMKWIRN